MPVLKIGIFWDIQNCPVPSGKSAAKVVERIRSLLGISGSNPVLGRFKTAASSSSDAVEAVTRLEEAFLVVCDVNLLSAEIVDELNMEQVIYPFMKFQVSWHQRSI